MAYFVSDTTDNGAIVFQTDDMQLAFAMRDQLNQRDDGRCNGWPRYLLGKA